ncbi:Fic family protein [Paenibacillus sp. Dod16]|uniref:Fic family protein n=1 Tax=Paenibacillus sp. Dod16 TaxID=3416392 RepID=UPI003CF1F647
MFDHIDTVRIEVNKRFPFRSELSDTIAQKFREEWTYHTNAIEGNTFTFQETAYFLREGLTIKGKSLREHQEIINHADAIDYLHEAVKEEDLTEQLVKDFHAIQFQGVRGIKFNPGTYKKYDNYVLTLSGNRYHYTPAIKVPLEMKQLIDWYKLKKTQVHPVRLAAVIHHKLSAIHPFTDGNGRVSRLIMNFILIKNGFPPAIIRNENREDYYTALEQGDKGKLQPFIKLITTEVMRSLEFMIKQND